MIRWIENWKEFNAVSEPLQALDSECFPESKWDESFWRKLYENRRLSVIVSSTQNRVEGFLAYSVLLDEIEILKIGVTRNSREKGVAKTMINWLVEWSKAQKVSIIHLEVREANHIATRLYDSTGFTQTGFRKNYYRDPVDNAIGLSCRVKQSVNE